MSFLKSAQAWHRGMHVCLSACLPARARRSLTPVTAGHSHDASGLSPSPGGHSPRSSAAPRPPPFLPGDPSPPHPPLQTLHVLHAGGTRTHARTHACTHGPAVARSRSSRLCVAGCRGARTQPAERARSHAPSQPPAEKGRRRPAPAPAPAPGVWQGGEGGAIRTGVHGRRSVVRHGAARRCCSRRAPVVVVGPPRLVARSRNAGCAFSAGACWWCGKGGRGGLTKASRSSGTNTCVAARSWSLTWPDAKACYVLASVKEKKRK